MAKKASKKKTAKKARTRTGARKPQARGKKAGAAASVPAPAPQPGPVVDDAVVANVPCRLEFTFTQENIDGLKRVLGVDVFTKQMAAEYIVQTVAKELASDMDDAEVEKYQGQSSTPTHDTP